MQLNPNRGSTYLDSQDSAKVSKSSRRTFSFLLSFIIATGVLVSGLSFVPSADPAASSLAYAATECEDGQEDCDEKTLQDGFDKNEYDESQAGFEKLMDDLEAKPDEANNPESILYAFTRHFTIGYMNEGDDATIARNGFDQQSLNWYRDTFKSRGKYNCGRGYGGAGSKYPGEEKGAIFWHNCDVPNLLTEFVQDVGVLFLEPGFQRGTTESSKTSTPWFGFSSNTPKNVTQRGGANVTALEVFGYNMKYTSYHGEWDYIKVMTAARALSNFGFLDKLKLGAQAILNGILGGVDAAVNGLVADLKSGNIARIITAPLRFIGNLFGGGVSSTVDTVIDTSDTNVFATMAWYRPTFGATLYNARALSQDEIVEYIQVQLAQYIQEIGKPNNAPVPEDLAAISPDKLAALDPPSPGACLITGTYTVAGGAPIEVNQSFPFTTEESCREAATGWRTTIRADAGGQAVTFNTVLDFQPRQTVAEWSTAAGWQGPVKQYGILCSLSDSDSTDPTAVTSFIQCMRDPNVGWSAAVARETKNKQTEINETWFQEAFAEKALVAFFRKQAASFTAPNAKYICLKPNGQDMRVNGNYVKLVIGTKNNMRYNPLCDPVRSPIQNGLFGNGYEGAQPPVDTRRSVFTPGTMVEEALSGAVSSAGLSITLFTTRVSNTFLNMAFAPILQTIGADTIISNIIVGLRDSLFFPLAVLIIALGAISIFFQAGVRRDFGNQGKSLLLIVGVFFLGVILMTDPHRSVRLVDEAPAHLEAAVAGTIFETGQNGNVLCNASTGPTNVGGEDFLGNTIAFDPASSTRNMLCENWRAFAFNTYVHGQWGTGYDNLNINNLSASGDQALLVGDGQGVRAPYVPLGGGGNNADRNWALYQLDVLTSGTTTTMDPQNSKLIDPNLYRMVDLQAGPGGELAGAPYNATYYEAWNGNQMGNRMAVSGLGALTSLIGMFTIAVFAFAKIQISLMATFMLLFMPIMFLIGLFPSQGRFKLKSYFLQLASLMVQRVVLVAMLALMLRIITTVANSTDNFFYYSMVTIATCVAFLVYRKEVLKLFGQSVNKTGDNSNFNIGEYMPKSLRNVTTRAYATGRYAAYGGLGGFMAGGVSGARAGAVSAAQRQGAMLTMKQARQGFGAFQTLNKARRAVQTEGHGELDKYFNKSLEPQAEAKARETLTNAGMSEDQIDANLAEETKRELERMRPDGKLAQGAQYRRLGEMQRAQKKITNTDKRSDRQVRRDMRDAVNTDAADPTTRLTQQARQAKPQVTDNEKHVEDYRSAVDKFTANVEKNYVRAGEQEAERAYRDARRDDLKLSALRGGVREDAEGEETTFADREEDRIVNRTTHKAYIRDSAKDIMREFRVEVEERLTVEDEDRE